MRTILNKSKQESFLDENFRFKTLHFKWGKSGYHRCTLLDKHNNKLGSAGGGGYDKKGTAFGQWITEHFQEPLKRLDSKKYYGLIHYNNKTKKRQQRASKHTKTYVDGACGFDSMLDILNRIGFHIQFVKEDRWNCYYLLIPIPKQLKHRLNLN
tara:strand:+ start:2615 stop:3076 length:462 start_codon:yes stop_codon:yes gene_type:complete